MTNTTFDNNKKIASAIARAEKTTTKRISLQEGYSEGEDMIVTAEITYRDIDGTGGVIRKQFKVFAVNETRLEAIETRNDGIVRFISYFINGVAY